MPVMTTGQLNLLMNLAENQNTPMDITVVLPDQPRVFKNVCVTVAVQQLGINTPTFEVTIHLTRSDQRGVSALTVPGTAIVAFQTL